MRRPPRPVRALVACGAAVACAVPAADAEAARLVTAKPSLKPAFRTGTPDYTVRCGAGGGARLSVDAPAGTRVAVAGGSPRGGRFEAAVDLAPGRAVRLRVIRGEHARRYAVRCLPDDFPAWSVRRDGRPQAAWYILTPNDNTLVPRYVAIFDNHGVPVWWLRQERPPFDASLLPDGNLAWTHWIAKNPNAGPFEERALDGRLVRTWATVGGSETNLHELQILPNGDALMIAYPPRDGVDLSPWGGPSDATVLDGEIQQVGPGGTLAWNWTSPSHLALAETGHWLHTLTHDVPPTRLADGRLAYDIVHVNSLDQLGDRLLFSARFEDAVYEIDKRTGKVVWKLGGTHTSGTLEIRGDPLAKREFGAQHDARYLDGGRIVTVYDNGHLRGRPPRALAFRIDRAKRTARLIREIDFAPARLSVCCGSARWLPGGHWVVAWGHTRWVTEQTRRGRPVLMIRFGQEGMMSYRAEPVLPGRLSRAALRQGMDAMAAP